MRIISVEEFHAEIKSQGVESSEDAALKCPVCGTVQSKRLLTQQGCPPEKVDTQIGFSCVGRWNNAGAYNKTKKNSKPGCDWTLGGLFRLHNLEVHKDGETHPMFDVATPAEAQKLKEELL